MRLAVPYWQGRVSPVLDAAERLLLVDFEDGRESTRQQAPLMPAGTVERARQLSELDVDVVICGALSRPLETSLRAAGLQIIPHICGYVEHVVAAFLEGRLEQDIFLMPGCCGRRRRFRGGRRRGGRWAERWQRGGEADATR